MSTINLNFFHKPEIKLQGPSYYSDCYTFWDLNYSKEQFEGPQYAEMVKKIGDGSHHIYSGVRSSMAVIDFQKYQHDYKSYYDRLSLNVQRDLRTAAAFKFYLREYDFRNFIFDFSEINRSQKQKKTVNPWYLRDPDNFKEVHSGYRHSWEDDRHYSKWYGVFRYLKNYKQGDLVTNEKLYAYCKIATDGELATVHLIWAHADYLKKGLMFYMICGIVEELIQNESLRCLAYGGFAQYPKWKARMLFEPHFIKATL